VVPATREQPVQRYSEVFRLGAKGYEFVVVVEICYSAWWRSHAWKRI